MTDGHVHRRHRGDHLGRDRRRDGSIRRQSVEAASQANNDSRRHARVRFPYFSHTLMMTMVMWYRIVERERRVDPANPNATERSPLMGRSPSLRDGHRTTERARRRDPVNPSTNERSPLLGISSGLPASSDTTKGVVYAGTRSESPRS